MRFCQIKNALGFNYNTTNTFEYISVFFLKKEKCFGCVLFWMYFIYCAFIIELWLMMEGVNQLCLINLLQVRVISPWINQQPFIFEMFLIPNEVRWKCSEMDLFMRCWNETNGKTSSHFWRFLVRLNIFPGYFHCGSGHRELKFAVGCLTSVHSFYWHREFSRGKGESWGAVGSVPVIPSEPNSHRWTVVFHNFWHVQSHLGSCLCRSSVRDSEVSY